MSKNEEKASEKELDAPENDSVFDFLYCASGRIGSFLAQFDDSGLLEKVIQRESASRGIKRGLELSVGGGAMLAGTGGSGSLGIKRGPSEEGSEASERVYNPLWANTLTFLDCLAERDLIADDITCAGIGQFVKISGILKVVDLTIIKRMIEHPTLARGLAAKSVSSEGANRGERRRDAAAARGTPAVPAKRLNDAEIGMAMASIFGMTTQATILDQHASVWCSLRDESLIVSPADLLLQHGLRIAGKWTAIGILDAKPGGSDDSSAEYSSAFEGALAQMIPVVRNVLGRPDSYFGVTPLLILRNIIG